MKFPPRFRTAAAALAAYSALALLTLHSLIFATGTQVAGFDYFNYNWNFWWIRYASTTPGLNIYLNDFVMYPALSNYGYHALTAVWYPVWALLEPAFGTLTVISLIIFLGCVLNGWTTFLLLRDEGVAPGLAFIGGAALQVLPISRYFYYNTHLNLMDWFWLPLALLTWKQIALAARAGRLPRVIAWSLIFGVMLWGVLLTDLQFPIFVAFALVPYGLRSLIGHPRRVWLIAGGALALSVGVGLGWFAGPLPYILRFQGELVPGPAEDRPGIAIPQGFLSMAEGWWNWNEPSLGAFVPAVVALAVVISLTRWRERLARGRWFWFLVMIPPLVFAIGPTLMLGETAVPLPYRFLHTLTNGMFRMPWRLAPIAVIAGLIFAGLTFTPLWRRLITARRLAISAASILALALAVRVYESAPLMPVLYPYSFYEDMRRETGGVLDEYAVYEVPTAAATGEVILGDWRAVQLQWYGMTHQKRMFNGFISRAPIDQFWYIVQDDPMMAWLGQRRPLEPEIVAGQMRDRVLNDRIGYFVVHTNLIGRETATIQEIVGFFNQLDDLLCHYTTEGDAIVYRARWLPESGCPSRTPPQTADGVYVIDIGTPGDERYLGWGWHWAERIFDLTLRWAGEYPEARLYVDLPPDDYVMTIMAQSFWEDRVVRLQINGADVGEPVTITTDALRPYAWSISADALASGQHIEIALIYDEVTVPAEVGQSADPRRLAISVDSVSFAREQQ